MANNYGMPFPYPHAHMSQAPFQPLPGLQPAAPSPQTVNSFAYEQNAQRPPLAPAAWPSDPNALLASFVQNMQSGHVPQFPPPPHLPNFAFPPPSLPQTPQLPAAPTAYAPQPIHPLAIASDRLQEMMDDREDGELSDSDRISRPSGATDAPQTGQRVEETYNPNQPAAGQAVTKKSAPKPPQPPPMPCPQEALQQRRDEAKQFVKLLHSNNMGYRTLANESLDLDCLRNLYSSLNLPSEPAPIAPPKTLVSTFQSSQTPPSTQSAPQKSTPAVKPTANPVPPVASAPSPIDRKEYIARLQAAKLAKQAGGAKPSPSQEASSASDAPSVQSVQTPQAATPTSKPQVTDEQRARTTELIRQRLEALKAKGQPTSITNGPASKSTQVRNMEQAQPHTTPSVLSGSSTPRAQAAAFPGIPGLFMNSSPSLANGASAASTTTSSVPQKRPLPSDSTETSTPHGSVTPYTRPLGDSPRAYQEEPMIIEVSDDESNGSEMDIDNDPSPPKLTHASPPATQPHRYYPGSIPDFPSQPGSTFPNSSAASTPGPNTAATHVREEELKKKEDELAAMRAKLKQRIAEKIAKDRADKAAALASVPTPQPSFPTTLQASDRTTSSSNQPSLSASDDAAELIRDVKRRRRAEIQTELPSIDAELASNEDKMARLAKELQELKALNQKIALDKQRLTDELESLGIDTDGMSHAEMQAKRDEIQQEATPEPTSAGPVESVSMPLAAMPSSNTSLTAGGSNNIVGDEQPKLPESPALSDTAGQYIGLPGLANAQTREEGLARPSQASTIDESPLLEKMSVTSQLHLTEDATTSSQSDNSGLAAGSLGTSTNQSSMPQPRDPASPPEDDEDFYSQAVAEPVIAETDTVENIFQDQDQPQQPVPGSPSEEGEVEMSESSGEEEEYEPEELELSEVPSPREAQALEPEITEFGAASDVSTEDEEPYEPPDVDEEMSDAPGQAENDASLDTLHVEAEDGAMDIASSSSEHSEDSESDEDSVVEAGLGDSISAPHNRLEDTNVADDVAPQLQPEATSEVVPQVEDEAELVKFTPYESPLRMFKSYRYHPNFAQDVAGGFLSPTFSHQIDSETPFCQYETAGGSCNDPKCPDQHFQGMGITGETLLVQLGTANPGKTSEEKQQWNDGLRGVLKELRKKSIKDPNGIAAEIANYRRKFLNDDTRVVNL